MSSGQTEHAKNERTMAFWTAAVGLFTVFLFFATALNTYLVYLAFNDSHASTVNTQRAFVTPSIFETQDGDSWLVRVKWKNSGATPAINVRSHVNSAFENPGAVQAGTVCLKDDKLNDSWQRDLQDGVVAPSVETEGGEWREAGKNLELIANHATALTIYGWAAYQDVFETKQTHIVRFYYVLLPSIRDGKITGFSSYPETSYNCTDASCDAAHYPVTWKAPQDCPG